MMGSVLPLLCPIVNGEDVFLLGGEVEGDLGRDDAY